MRTTRNTKGKDQKEGLYDLKIGSWSQLNIYLGGFGA